MQRTVRTTDGRVLAVEEAGDPAGRPVLVHGGTPGSRLLYGPHVRDAAERGLRLIGYDRPGYGGSSPQPGRTVADCASDVRAICADLGIDRLAMWGASGGGPHVLACAALLPDLVAAAATLASLAPFDADGLDYFDGMAPENVDDTLLYFTDEAAARAKTDRDRAEILAEAPGDATETADGGATDHEATDDEAAADSGPRSPRSTRRPSPTGLATFSRPRCGTGWRRAATAGGRTTACSGRGDSASPTSPSRSCCCTAGRTSSCRSATASGWRRTFPA